MGDRCQVPAYIRLQSSGRSITRWHDAEVVAVRQGAVIVSSYGFESEHSCSDLRLPPRHVGNSIVRLLNRFGHDRHRRSV